MVWRGTVWHGCNTCEEEEDIPLRLSEVDLHDRDEGCIHVITLRCLGVQNLHGEGAPRDPANTIKAHYEYQQSASNTDYCSHGTTGRLESKRSGCRKYAAWPTCRHSMFVTRQT